MKRFMPFAVAILGTIVAFAMLRLVIRTGVPEIRLPDRAWRRGLADVVDEVSEEIEEALE